MRDYVLSQAEFLDRGSVFPELTRLVRNWRKRRELRQLLDLDDRLLKDIGVSRPDIEYVLSLPLEVDPQPELERLALIDVSSRPRTRATD